MAIDFYWEGTVFGMCDIEQEFNQDVVGLQLVTMHSLKCLNFFLAEAR